VKRACEKLEADLSGKLTLQEIAAELDISVSHFRERYGRPSACHHINGSFANASVRPSLMTVGRPSLAEIAIAAGFANQSHFTRVFSSLMP
jgi:AraC family transcriptional regulator